MDNTIGFEIKHLYEELSPLIERFTRKLCPECRQPCCKQRFGIYEKEDILFLNSINAKISDANRRFDPDGKCQFLSSRGCIRPRWLRPYRCTWFFCTELLEAMQTHSRQYRRIVDLLNRIKQLRMELLGLK
ncbi:MAG: hypothetical protein GXO97_09600 [Nitrospirae bacterium]|nr:hypothetical protein [Nitrospirota bacterium]